MKDLLIKQAYEIALLELLEDDDYYYHPVYEVKDMALEIAHERVAGYLDEAREREEDAR